PTRVARVGPLGHVEKQVRRHELEESGIGDIENADQEALDLAILLGDLDEGSAAIGVPVPLDGLRKEPLGPVGIEGRLPRIDAAVIGILEHPDHGRHIDEFGVSNTHRRKSPLFRMEATSPVGCWVAVPVPGVWPQSSWILYICST